MIFVIENTCTLCLVLVIYLKTSISKVEPWKIQDLRNKTLERRYDNDKIANMEGRIVGGSFGKIEDYPHCVFLHVYCNDAGFKCGASIVNQRILLTAGHCVYKCTTARDTKLTAHIGSTDKTKSSQKILVQRYIVHPEYDPYFLDADVALLYLASNIRFSKTAQRVILRKQFPNQRGLRATVAGWGAINEDKVNTNMLKYVQQNVYNSKECYTKYNNLARYGAFCAQGAKGYAFVGDSGSALITADLQQIGVVSYRGRDPVIKDVTYYANTSFFYDWILKHSTILYCNEALNKG